MFFESPQFGEHFCPKNSSQHQTSTACIRTCRRNRATPPLPRSPVRFLTSTPKPRAEGSSPSAPAKNREASTMLASLFFVSAHKDSTTRHGCALRSACRGALVAGGDRPRRRSRLPPRSVLDAPHWGAAPEAAAETSPSCDFRHVMEESPSLPLLYSILSHPSPTAATLSSTQNAPGFAFFGSNRVRFSLFCCFLAAKFLPWFLCTLLHSVYKLKPSVIPCKREVSFLT